MNDITGIIVVLTAIVCMFLAQSKNVSKSLRRQYSFLGSMASLIIAVEASRRGEVNIAILFAAAAVISLGALAFDYIKPTKPDA